MPPLPSVPQVLKIELMGSDSGGFPWANIIHMKYTGSAPDSTVCNNIAEAISVAWGVHISGLVHADVSLNVVKVTDLTSPAGAVGEFATPVPGSRAGSLIPGSAAFLESYLSDAPRYRGGHARQYLLCGVQADLLDEAHWTDAFTASAGNAWGAFVFSQIGTVFDTTTISSLVAVSYYTTDYGPPKVRIRRAVPLVYNLLSVAGNKQLASQRRRIGRRRR